MLNKLKKMRKVFAWVLLAVMSMMFYAPAGAEASSPTTATAKISPTNHQSVDGAEGFFHPEKAYTQKHGHAMANDPDDAQIYKGYHFDIPNDTKVTSVKVVPRAKSNDKSTWGSKFEVQISGNNGKDWLGPKETGELSSNFENYPLSWDTNSWTGANLLPDKFKVKITSKMIGGNAQGHNGNKMDRAHGNGPDLNWIPVVVNYTKPDCHKTHTVTFNSMGGSSVAPYTNVPHNDTIKKPVDPTWIGYYFDAWYTGKKHQKAWDFDNDKVKKDITLYAKWIVNNQPIITLNGNDPMNVEYGDSYIDPGAVWTDDVDGTGPVTLISGDVVDTRVLGSYIISYNYTDSGGLPAAEVTRTVNVVPRAITITADSATKVFGTADPTLTYSITSGTLVIGDSLTGSLDRETGEAVGSYPITQGSLIAGSNYATTFVGDTFTITAAVVPPVTPPVLPPTTTVTTAGIGGPAIATTDFGIAGAEAADDTDEAIASDETANTEDVRGDEEVKDEEDICPWWWIIGLILIGTLIGAWMYLKSKKEKVKELARANYAWPIALGAIAYVAHYYLHGDYKATWFCDWYFYVVAIIIIVAYYPFYNLISGREEKK